jgi:hypothetical protein
VSTSVPLVDPFERAFVAVSVLVGGRGAGDLLAPSPAAQRLDEALRAGGQDDRVVRLGAALLPLAQRLEARGLP